MKRNPNALFTTAALVGCAFLFAAASCESKKPTPEVTVEPVTSQKDSLPEAGKDEVYDEKTPQDVGPKAPAVFAITGLQGYTEPCGCTLDVMLGGIDRITQYVEDARKLYPAVEFVDAGDLWFETTDLAEHEIPQEKAKIDVVRQGLAKMRLAVTVPGEKDFALGADYYMEQVRAGNIRPIAANLTIEGVSLSPTHKANLDGVETLFIGVVDPTLYEGIEGVSASEPDAALAALADEITAADATIVLAHGDLPFAKRALQAADGADFAVVGHPRETDQVDSIDGAYTLEPYDQGRYFGILKLINAAEAKGKSFQNTRTGSKAELEKIDGQIEHVNASINKLPPASPGEEPQIILTLRKRLEDLEARKQEIQNADLEIPEDEPSFLWRSVPMEPGYGKDDEMKKVREQYNKQLKELNSSVEFEVPAAAKGEAVFVGSNTCTTCHAPATKFWESTAHAKALVTLEERDKDFDQKCIGCHVVGYEQPGGSVIGKLQYDASLENPHGQAFDVSKDLRHVGCESCHGPGSNHWFQPVGADGAPANIIRDPGPEQCSQCHVPEHSPRFVYDVYVEQITGEGHARGD